MGSVGFCYIAFLQRNSFSCGVLRGLFFFGDCLNSMLFGLLRRVLCNMCLVGAECAGVLMLDC